MELDDLQLCYFAALIHGLRIIDEKARDLNLDPRDVEMDAGALIHFVRVKGDQLVKIHFGNKDIPKESGILNEEPIQAPVKRPVPAPVVGKKRRSKYNFVAFPRKLPKSELAEIEQIVLDRQSV